MEKRKIVSIILLSVGLILSVAFFLSIDFPEGFELYFKRAYYNQFGALALSVELLIAGYYLYIGHKKTNFALALFGFMALLDPIFNQIGLFNSVTPLYGTIVLSLCALPCLWIAFKNTFQLERLSRLAALVGLILGVIIELLFNYF